MSVMIFSLCVTACLQVCLCDNHSLKCSDHICCGPSDVCQSVSVSVEVSQHLQLHQQNEFVAAFIQSSVFLFLGPPCLFLWGGGGVRGVCFCFFVYVVCFTKYTHFGTEMS